MFAYELKDAEKLAELGATEALVINFGKGPVVNFEEEAENTIIVYYDGESAHMSVAEI